MPHWFVCTILASGFGLATVVLGFDLQGAITLIAGLLLALITLFGLRPTSSIRVMTMSTSFGVQPSALISRSEYLSSLPPSITVVLPVSSTTASALPDFGHSS